MYIITGAEKLRCLYNRFLTQSVDESLKHRRTQCNAFINQSTRETIVISILTFEYIEVNITSFTKIVSANTNIIRKTFARPAVATSYAVSISVSGTDVCFSWKYRQQIYTIAFFAGKSKVRKTSTRCSFRTLMSSVL